MISFVLPFYRKFAWFLETFPLNLMHFKNNEVVCVLDEPSEEVPMVRFAEQHKEVNLRVIVNDTNHPWRPPCIPYNVGIWNSRGTHIVLFDAESVLTLPCLGYLESLIVDGHEKAYGGLVWHVDTWQHSPVGLLRACARTEATSDPCFWGYGFMLCPKPALETVCGYDESRTVYGHDDDDIRMRLTRSGLIFQIDPLIKAFHLWHDNPMKRSDKVQPRSPNVVLAHQRDTWGRAYSRIAYDCARV